MWKGKEVIQVVAINNKGYIGRDGDLMWFNKEDLQHFKKTTMWNTLVVGRKTYNSLPAGVFQGRILYQVSRTNGYTLEEALDKAAQNCNNDKIYIIGGAEIYKATADITDKVILSKIDDNQDGDVSYALPEHLKSVSIDVRDSFTIETWTNEEVQEQTEQEEVSPVGAFFSQVGLSAMCGTIPTGTFELTVDSDEQKGE